MLRSRAWKFPFHSADPTFLELYFSMTSNIQVFWKVKLRCELNGITNVIREMFKVSDIRTPLTFTDFFCTLCAKSTVVAGSRSHCAGTTPEVSQWPRLRGDEVLSCDHLSDSLKAVRNLQRERERVN